MPLVSHHEVHVAPTVREALAFLGAHRGEGWRPIAGGTDVMVEIDHGRERGARWLDVSRLRAELGAIEREGDRVRIGGLATMTDLRRSALCREVCPMIAEAAATVGAVQIQNRATVAGNIVNASPAGDTLPVWLALDAEVEMTSTNGTRRVLYRDFTTAYRTAVLREDELLSAVLVRRPPAAARCLFRKVGTRAAQAISKVVLAAVAVAGPDDLYTDVRLAFGSMAETPRRAAHAERAAQGAPRSAETGRIAAQQLSADFSPIDDVRSTAAYRMAVARNLVREFLAGTL
jgi:CO/xanthine dehydrogenase FAD-binding subunit